MHLFHNWETLGLYNGEPIRKCSKCGKMQKSTPIYYIDGYDAKWINLTKDEIDTVLWFIHIYLTDSK